MGNRRNDIDEGNGSEMTDAPQRILVIDRRGSLSIDIAKAAAALDSPPEVLRVSRPTHAAEAAETHLPDVIVAGPEEITHAGLRRLGRVHKAHPRAVVLLAPNGRSAVSIQETAASGASDVITYPSTPARLRKKIVAALETADQLRADQVVVRSARAMPEARLGHVMTISSASGGCGKTFYATNIAAYLSKATGGRVLLVDLDLQFGEVAISLRLRPGRTIAELVEEEDVAEVLPNYVVTHAAGYDVLCAPEDPVAAERVGPREATAVLEAAQAQYDYVVVDTPPALNEVVLAAFDRSRSLVVMATLDVPSLRNLRTFLQTLDRLKLSADEVSLVVNKAERGVGIDLGRVERVYPQGFSSVLPYAPEVTRSLNQGSPVIVSAPGAEVSQQFIDGAKRLVAPKPGAELAWAGTARRRGPLSRIFGRKEKGAA